MADDIALCIEERLAIQHELNNVKEEMTIWHNYINQIATVLENDTIKRFNKRFWKRKKSQ